MKAEKARQIAQGANFVSMDDVYEAIEREAKLGEYHCHIYRLLKPEHVKKLEEDGFVVENVSERNETCIYIGWEPKQATAKGTVKK